MPSTGAKIERLVRYNMVSGTKIGLQYNKFMAKSHVTPLSELVQTPCYS
jgi:hypothetical protein